VTVSTYAWYGDKSLNLDFPVNWSVKKYMMMGHGAVPLSNEQIKKRLDSPIGTSPLSQLAKGKKQCAIVVDDLTRPTKANQIIPHVISELIEAGFTDDKIRFVMALGCHHWMRLDDLRKKLGSDIPERFHIFEHNVYENNVYVGETKLGVPLYVNKEVMSCDLKITIGSIIPHESAGFGGGGKIVLPGVSSIDTITEHHKKLRQGIGVGRVADNQQRQTSDEAARMIGIDFMIDAILNENRDCCEIVCGEPVEAFKKGVEIARKHYATKTEDDVDIAIVNGYPMENEAYKALRIGIDSVREDGDVVILLHTPEGCRGHFYNGRFGMDYGGRGWGPEVYVKKPWRMKRIIAVTPHISLSDKWYYGCGSIWVKSWKKAMTLLTEEHEEKNPIKVAVYPYAAMQISEKNAAQK
jgi:nickel-dependent lactate racemase